MAPKPKQNSKAKTASKKSAAEPTGGFTLFLFQPKTLLLLAIVVSATFLIPIAVHLLPDLSQRDEFVLPVTKININQPPHWVPQDLVQQAITLAGLPDEISVLDDDLTHDVAEAFQLHPWVADVVSVHKSVPAQIDVELKYRRPVAMVQVKQGMYPIDADGTLLPPEDFSVADTSRYPVIQNVVSTPQGAEGTNWGDLTVVGAARLAEILVATDDSESFWQSFAFVAIRVPDRTKAKIEIDELIFQLLTQGGSRIVWGRAPGTGHPGELSAEKKIGRLKKYITRYGGFDQPNGPYEIDIHHWQEISRRPLAARNSKSRR